MTFGEARRKLGTFLVKTGNALLNGSRKVRASTDSRLNNLQYLWFLADAPLFIDSNLVERLYDSIFRPEFEVATRTRSEGNAKSQELSTEISGTAEISVPTIFKISSTPKLGGKFVNSVNQSVSLMEAAVQSSENRLEKLINLYVYSYPDRLFLVNTDLITAKDIAGKSSSWEGMEQRLDDPGIRPLVVLDLEPKSRVIPMAAESDKGEVSKLYQSLLKKVDPDNTVPQYPVYGSPDFEKLNQAYWKSLYNVFNSQDAMHVVEDSITKGGRLDWIDYRLVGFNNNMPVPLHLHLSPRGKYPTGTFAYQFIRRAEKFGVRIIGTLKKGHDINVLAIYER